MTNRMAAEWHALRHRSKGGGPGIGAQRVEGSATISCGEMLTLFERCYSDDWSDAPALEGVAWHHLETCRGCYSKLVDLELGFEATLIAESEEAAEADEVEADIIAGT